MYDAGAVDLLGKVLGAQLVSGEFDTEYLYVYERQPTGWLSKLLARLPGT
jgi:hypothetical protein